MIIKEKLRKFGVPLLAGLVVLGSIGGFAGTKAFAASQQTTQPAKQEATEQTPAYKASIFLGQQDNGKDESKDKAAEEKNDKNETLNEQKDGTEKESQGPDTDNVEVEE